MKKLFLAIYFMTLFLISESHAKVSEINDLDQAQETTVVQDRTLPDGMPDPNNLEEVAEFFRQRFLNASVSSIEEIGDVNKSNAINIQHSAEYIAQMQEDNKSTFEKIYNSALDRISGTSDMDQETETVFYRQADQQINPVDDINIPDLSVINVSLPNGTKIMAPAKEHIPYLLVSYNLLPTGLIQVQEDITVVANGKKLKNGLIKILNKNSISRTNVKKKVDVQLLSVTLNGKEIPYTLEEIGNNYYFKPKDNYALEPGVYNYKIKYLLDRKLWYYDDFSEFYVDVTGSYLNLVITSANAIVSVPDGRNFLSQNVIIGSGQHLSSERAIIASLDTNALGFASVTPLLPGEGMHILTSLDKDVFLEPDWNRRFVWMVTDYGDILFALAGFLAIFLSYMLSWKYLKKEQRNKKTGSLQLPETLRYILQNAFDKTAFVAGLLALVQKGVIDIQKQNDTIILVKKTDNLSKLSFSQKKVMKELFAGRETALKASVVNVLKFKRAYAVMEKSVRANTKLAQLKFTFGYLLFSFSMLILSEIAIAQLSVNPAQTSLILISSSLTVAFYLWVFYRKFKNKILNWGAKIFAGLFIAAAVLLLSVYIHLITALLIVSMLWCIFEYNRLFAKHNELIKSKHKNVDDLKKYLIANQATISKTMAFGRYQAYIFALGLENDYPQNQYNQEIYKLDLAHELKNLL